MAKMIRSSEARTLKDVYLELTPDNTLQRMAVTDAGGIRRGDLQRFMEQSIGDAMRHPFVPDNIILHYEGVRPEDIPSRQESFGEDRAPLLQFILNHGVDDNDMYSLRRAAYLVFHGERITPKSLSEVAGRESYRQFAAHEHAQEKFLEGRPVKMMLTVAETDRGILVFSDSLRGRKAQTDYMQHMADNFFSPEHEGLSFMQLFRFETASRPLIERSDACCRLDEQGSCRYDFTPVLNSQAALLHGREPIIGFDMRPTGQNLDTYLNHTGLQLSACNNDILTLADIAQDGYRRAAGGAFSFREEFRDIDRALEKLSHRSRMLPAETFQKKYGQIQEDAKALARHILHEVIRIRREPSAIVRNRLENHRTQVTTSEGKAPAVTSRTTRKTVKPKL